MPDNKNIPKFGVSPFKSTPDTIKELENKIDGLEEKLDTLINAVSFIFEDHVLVNGQWRKIPK